MTLSIGEVAAATGLRASALRYYEEVGLLRPAGRRGGRRHYDPDVLGRLALIALCQEAGFTIAEIRDLLDGEPSAERWRGTAERKLDEIDRRIDGLETTRGRLRAALDCACEPLGRCELVDAAGRRRAGRPARP